MWSWVLGAVVGAFVASFIILAILGALAASAAEDEARKLWMDDEIQQARAKRESRGA